MNTIELRVSIPVDGPVDPNFVSEFQESLQSFFPGLLASENTSNHEDVRRFHEKFCIPSHFPPSLLDPTTLEFRLRFLIEELQEFITANGLPYGLELVEWSKPEVPPKSLHDAADALIDLAYVVHGTAIMMGLPWQLLWDVVQRANMSKIRATSEEQSKRGSTLDVVKPAGWRAPDFTPILGGKE